MTHGAGDSGSCGISVADRLGARVGAQRAELGVAEAVRVDRIRAVGEHRVRAGERRGRPRRRLRFSVRARRRRTRPPAGRFAAAVDPLPVVACLAARTRLRRRRGSRRSWLRRRGRTRGQPCARWVAPLARRSPAWTQLARRGDVGRRRAVSVEVGHALRGSLACARATPAPGLSGARKSSPCAAHSASMASTCSARVDRLPEVEGATSRPCSRGPPGSRWSGCVSTDDGCASVWSSLTRAAAV